MRDYELHEIEMKDYAKLKSYFELRPARTCESIVNSSYIWKEYYRARYYINEYGIVFIYNVAGEIFSSSPLCKKEDIAPCLENMKQYFNEVLKQKLLMYVADKDTVEALIGHCDMDESGHYENDLYIIDEDRKYFDYVYDAEKLRNLSGKKYHKKKNHVNGFLKEYAGRYECIVLKPSDKRMICEFLDRWHDLREINDEFNRDDYEIEGIKNLLSDCEKTDIEMFGVLVDGQLEAFTLGTYLKDLQMVFIHVEKANPGIRGLYTFINQQFLVQRFPQARLVNREDDMGLEGLRQAKLSYFPLYMEKKYTIRQK